MSKHVQCCCGAGTIGTVSIYGKAGRHYRINTTCVWRKHVARGHLVPIRIHIVVPHLFHQCFTSDNHDPFTCAMIPSSPLPMCISFMSIHDRWTPSQNPHLWMTHHGEWKRHTELFAQLPLVVIHRTNRATLVPLSEMFVLNDEHRYMWTITGIDYSQTDEHYVTYITCGTNCHGNVSVVVLQKWSEV
jgi:hypothetical protein